MFEIYNAAWLDARHCICTAADKDGEEHWLLLTFFQDCSPGTDITLRQNDDGYYFEITEVDPDSFWFNGKHYKLEKTVNKTRV